MGKALTLIGMWMFINIIGMIVALGAYSIDPNTELLASNGLLGSESMINPYINNRSSSTDSWSFNNTLKNDLPQGSATSTGTTGTSYPDWINSSLEWIKTILSVLLNIVGAPYTFIIWTFGSSVLAAVIGIGFSIMNLFILVNWIFGKVD